MKISARLTVMKFLGLSVKVGMRIGEWNEGNDGNSKNQGGMRGIRVGMQGIGMGTWGMGWECGE